VMTRGLGRRLSFQQLCLAGSVSSVKPVGATGVLPRKCPATAWGFMVVFQVTFQSQPLIYVRSKTGEIYHSPIWPL